MSFQGYLLFSCDFKVLNVILESYRTIEKAWNDQNRAKLKKSKIKDGFCETHRGGIRAI